MQQCNKIGKKIVEEKLTFKKKSLIIGRQGKLVNETYVGAWLFTFQLPSKEFWSER